MSMRARMAAMEPRAPLLRVRGVDGVMTEDLAAFYARTCAPLIGLLASIGGSRSDAEEVAQDAFVKLLDHWDAVHS